MKEPSTPPPGCVSVEEHERKLTALADQLEARLAAFMSEADGRLGMSAINATSAQIISARRRAAELARIREEVVAFREAMEHERQMSGIHGARPHRTPLRKVQ